MILAEHCYTVVPENYVFSIQEVNVTTYIAGLNLKTSYVILCSHNYIAVSCPLDDSKLLIPAFSDTKVLYFSGKLQLRCNYCAIRSHISTSIGTHLCS